MAYYRVAWWFVFFPGARAAHHDRRVQRARRQRARRARPAPRHGLAAASGGAGMIALPPSSSRVERARGLGGRDERVRHLLRRAARRRAADRRPPGERADDRRSCATRLGLDQPVGVQYCRFLATGRTAISANRFYAGAGDRDRGARLSGHRLARPRQRGAVARDRRRRRRDRGDRRRSPIDHAITGDRARLLLDADVPARAAAALLPVLPALPGRVRVLPARVLRRVQRESAAVGALPRSCRGCRLRSSRPPPTLGSRGAR